MPGVLDHTMSPPDVPDRKATFFCSNCGREEPVDEDWVVNSASQAYEYVCPACSTVVLSQPRFDQL